MKGKNVVLGVTGGIAAFRAAQIARDLTKLGANVYCILTKNALNFITQQTMETLSGNPVVVDMFARPDKWEVEHISLAQRADVFLVAPASANFLGKVAAGVADDMLTTTIMATKAPIVIAPAMNTNLYENPVNQRNMRTLKELLNVIYVEPETGLLACNVVGKGHIASDEDIIAAVCKAAMGKRDLEGKKVLVTAGPTREALDPVRYLTNRSSGKMGYAIAEAAAKRGATVTLVSGPVALEKPANVERVFIESTMDLYAALEARCGEQDVIIQAAAPADYRPEQVAEQKIKKNGDEPFDIHLVQNPDVAAMVGSKKRPGQILVGFAAETQNLSQNAAKKLEKKNLDFIVGNDVTAPGAGFDVDTNIVTFFDREGETVLPLMKKTEVADKILDHIVELMQK